MSSARWGAGAGFVRCGLALLLSLAAACSDADRPDGEAVAREAAPAILGPEAVERLEMPGGAAPLPITLARETRYGVWRSLPHTSRLCLPDTLQPPGARLSLALGAEADGVAVTVASGGRALERLPVGLGWQGLQVEASELAGGCLELRSEGSPRGRVAVARPQLVRPGTRRPWIVIYLVDTLRYDRIRAEVAGVPVAPTFARFADEGISYERAIGTSSWTRTTVASLLTGLTAADHRVYGFPDRLPAKVARLATALADAGYRTVALSTNPNIMPAWGFLEGFDRFVDLDVRIGSERLPGLQRMIGAAVDAVAEEPAAPLFLYVHDNGVHVPYQSDPATRELFGAPPAGSPAEHPDSVEDEAVLEGGRRLYAAAIHAADARFARLLAALRHAGRYEDGIVVLVGDHGEEFGEHGGLEHGKTLYQEQIHVPLVVKPPGGGGGRVDAAVSTTSLAATLLDLAGVAVPPGMRAPLALPGQSGAHTEPIVSELDLLERSGESAIRWPWKYLVADDGEGHLFDLSADPGERRDLAGDHPVLVAELSAALVRARRGANSGLGLACIAGLRKAAVRLSVDAVGGELGSLEPLGLEAGDGLSGSAGTAVVQFELLPGRGPMGLTPEILARATADRDGFRAPEFSAIAVRVLVDGSGPRATHVLGAAGEELPVDGTPIPLERITRSDPPHLLEPGRETTCYLYYVPAEARGESEVEIGPELEERLRELGYAE